MVLERFIRGFDSPPTHSEDQNPVSLSYEFGGLWKGSLHNFGSLLKQVRQSRLPGTIHSTSSADNASRPCLSPRPTAANASFTIWTFSCVLIEVSIPLHPIVPIPSHAIKTRPRREQGRAIASLKWNGLHSPALPQDFYAEPGRAGFHALRRVFRWPTSRRRRTAPPHSRNSNRRKQETPRPSRFPQVDPSFPAESGIRTSPSPPW
jgi:hypothetical protein